MDFKREGKYYLCKKRRDKLQPVMDLLDCFLFSTPSAVGDCGECGTFVIPSETLACIAFAFLAIDFPARELNGNGARRKTFSKSEKSNLSLYRETLADSPNSCLKVTLRKGQKSGLSGLLSHSFKIKEYIIANRNITSLEKFVQ